MEGTPPMSLSENETGVKRSIIIIIIIINVNLCLMDLCSVFSSSWLHSEA